MKNIKLEVFIGVSQRNLPYGEHTIIGAVSRDESGSYDATELPDAIHGMCRDAISVLGDRIVAFNRVAAAERDRSADDREGSS